tara:strand:+ start:1907 stop:2311 length:405 start_codon:yes stop_codon:yes gene_type:complete
MKVMKSNCGASVKSSQKPKKMNSGGFMKIGGDLQKLDVNKREEQGMYGGGMKTRSATPRAGESGKKKTMVKPKPKPKPKPKKRTGPTRMSTGGMAEKKREEAAKEKEEKGGKKYKKGELVEAYKGKHMKKKKKY